MKHPSLYPKIWKNARIKIVQFSKPDVVYVYRSIGLRVQYFRAFLPCDLPCRKVRRYHPYTSSPTEDNSCRQIDHDLAEVPTSNGRSQRSDRTCHSTRATALSCRRPPARRSRYRTWFMKRVSLTFPLWNGVPNLTLNFEHDNSKLSPPA